MIKNLIDNLLLIIITIAIVLNCPAFCLGDPSYNIEDSTTAAPGNSELGTELLCSGNLCIDTSHTEDGYFYAGTGLDGVRQKLRVMRDGTEWTYNISNGDYIAVPLQFGSGQYNVELYRHEAGMRYRRCGNITLNVVVNDTDEVYLHPNIYVDYADVDEIYQLMNAMKGGRELSQSCYFEKVKEYIRDDYCYDYIRAYTRPIYGGIDPDIRYTVENRMGICQDLASLAAALLRAGGIPAKFVVGYADGGCHAWVEAKIDGAWVMYDPTATVSGMTYAKEYVATANY